MANLNGAYSYGDSSIKEDLWDAIKDLDPLELHVTSTSENFDVTNKVHSWNIDPIASTTTGAGTIELSDTVYADTQPTLYSNFTQIIEKGFRVSKTSQNSAHAGFSDKYAREQMKKMKEWKQNLEISAVVGTLVSGTGTAARSMQGFVRFAGLGTAMSGVSLTSDILNQILSDAWANGGEHDTLLVGSTLKQRISSFTAGNTKEINAVDNKIVARVDIYESDFGTVQVVLHRYINNAAANTYNVLATYLQDYVQIGFMDKPHYEDRAITGYYKAGAIVGEATVQLANPNAASLNRGLL